MINLGMETSPRYKLPLIQSLPTTRTGFPSKSIQAPTGKILFKIKIIFMDSDTQTLSATTLPSNNQSFFKIYMGMYDREYRIMICSYFLSLHN